MHVLQTHMQLLDTRVCVCVRVCACLRAGICHRQVFPPYFLIYIHMCSLRECACEYFHLLLLHFGMAANSKTTAKLH